MLQDTTRNDTVLEQLDQTVEIHSSKSLDVSRNLILHGANQMVSPVRISDSVDLVNKEFIPVLQKQNSLKLLTDREDTMTLALLAPIEPLKVTLLTEELGKPEIILPVRPIDRNTPDWIVGIFILALLLLATVRLFFNKYLGQLFTSAVNFSTASRMFREKSLSLAHASFRLDMMFYLIFSLFLFQAARVFHVGFHQVYLVEYATIFAGVLAYFILKKFIYFLQGNLCESTTETSEYLFNMNNYNRVLGLFLLPVSLIVAFTPLAETEWVIGAGFLMTGMIYILLIFRGIKILMRKHFSIFYLILYLCTLEILPLLFIYKLVLG